MATSTQLVKLKNGSTVSRAFLEVVMIELKSLKERNPVEMKKLREACVADGLLDNATSACLKDWFFIPGTSTLHPSVRNVLTCAIEDCAVDTIRIGSPLDQHIAA